MNPDLQEILNTIKSSPSLSEEEKTGLTNSVSKVNKKLEVVNFMLERTEKVKRTTAILLEETIEELEQKRKAIEESHEALKKSMKELKTTQAQLVHAEKMASLGELTAGIAHEIQNPLNFVNNFSELNTELILELKEEIENQDWEEVKAIAEDISGNEEKIKHHGKRADGIVKGMLQHSRTTITAKEPTDINQLADEYLRLAYHGLRAKDKSFNADFKIELDDNLPEIKVVPQDIGRVLLNLINNAFHATSEKSKISGDKYKPLVSVITQFENGTISIKVRDNGNGIPEDILDKIFQPFFTTKPTGEGTGLGLSLAYDIIQKGHGGEIKVETKEGEGLPAGQTGTTFSIIIPIQK